MRLLALLLSLCVGAPLFAQGKRPEDRTRQSMSQEDRRQLRDELQQRDLYRDRSRRPERSLQTGPEWRQMSPEDREKLRRDIQDANRDMRRR